MTDIRCPKCGCRSLKMIEANTTYYTYAVIDGYVKKLQRQNKTYISLWCIDCQHKWRPDNIEFEVDEH